MYHYRIPSAVLDSMPDGVRGLDVTFDTKSFSARVNVRTRTIISNVELDAVSYLVLIELLTSVAAQL